MKKYLLLGFLTVLLSFSVVLAEDYKSFGEIKLNVGENVTVDGNSISLENVGSYGSVRVYVDNFLCLIEGGSGTCNDLGISVVEYHYDDYLVNRWAKLNFGTLDVTTTTTIPGSTTTTTIIQNYNPKVLYITLNPVEGDKNLAEEFYSWSWRGEYEGKSVEEVEDYIALETINVFKRLSAGTINYEVVKKIHITEFPTYTNGFEYNFEKYRNCAIGDPDGVCESQKFKFDTVKWVRDNKICEIADENDVDEIWVITSPFITTWESFMIGPSDSFDINGAAYNIPECKKHYAVIGPNYFAPSPFLHPYGHRIEATMNYLTQDWKRNDYQRYWEDFSAESRYSEPYGQDRSYEKINCGNADFPHNALRHYDYVNQDYKYSSCVD